MEDDAGAGGCTFHAGQISDVALNDLERLTVVRREGQHRARAG